MRYKLQLLQVTEIVYLISSMQNSTVWKKIQLINMITAITAQFYNKISC